MSDRVEVAVWAEAYVDGFRRVTSMLTGISRKRERAAGCLKVLVGAAEALTSRAPLAIGRPSVDHASALAQIAGAAGEHVSSLSTAAHTGS